MSPEEISINDYHYHLPEHKIAIYPLEERDASKLLVHREGKITDAIYKDLPIYLPGHSMMVFNNTKVIHARIRFMQTSGKPIEIFCLEPFGEIQDYATVLSSHSTVTWKCLVGGASRWKTTILEKTITINQEKVSLHASIKEKQEGTFIISFSWNPQHFSFAEILLAAGDVPLPPYIKRETEDADEERYQTVYAEKHGSVAAPTAGLHFTNALLDELVAKKIIIEKVTLHVGAGTFKPVQAEQMKDHEMHAEWIDVDEACIRNIADTENLVVAVGTTSLRTLETLYWLGVKAWLQPETEKLELGQWDCYNNSLPGTECTKSMALNALLNWMKRNQKERLFTQTQLLITPGYRFRIAGALITNFHQPHSTLLLLVAAVIGDKWKEVYQHALDHEYRFLSFGDGSLLFMVGL